eukprot:287496-Hanusia_phi.AAC.1
MRPWPRGDMTLAWAQLVRERVLTLEEAWNQVHAVESCPSRDVLTRSQRHQPRVSAVPLMLLEDQAGQASSPPVGKPERARLAGEADQRQRDRDTRRDQ